MTDYREYYHELVDDEDESKAVNISHYRDRYYELRDAAGRLVDAMGHDPECAYIKDTGGIGCDCGGWPSMVMLRGELTKLVREVEDERNGS